MTRFGTRHLSTSSSESIQTPKSKRRPWAIIILSFCTGGIISAYALRPQRSQAKTPTYGNLVDFQAAIHDLQEAFPDEDRVTTDPDDLHDHGFSVNDYHPGEVFRASINIPAGRLQWKS